MARRKVVDIGLDNLVGVYAVNYELLCLKREKYAFTLPPYRTVTFGLTLRLYVDLEAIGIRKVEYVCGLMR